MNENWREQELNLKEVIQKYSEFPPLEALKIDVDRRGVQYTEAAFALVDPSKHHTLPVEIEVGGKKTLKNSPIGILYRDGGVSCNAYHKADSQNIYREPYLIDAINGKPYLVDRSEPIEEVTFWEKPDFFDKVTSNGTPMSRIATARPQRITIDVGDDCHFWDKPGNGCKYCAWHAGAVKDGKKTGCNQNETFYQDVYETFVEALKQKGRFCSFHVVSGSVLSGKELFDDEVEHYIKVIQSAQRAIKVDKFPIKMVASAFNKRQLKRLYNETALTTYTTDLEVLNEELFNWICPGKAEFVGYREWKQRLYDAVEIFGRGNVDCGLVSGVELAQPNGFQSEDEALEAILKEADEIGSHGVSFAECVWQTSLGSIFFNQKTPSLEYYVRVAQGLADVRRKYHLNIYIDDYRRCGNHPNTDLARID